MKLKKGERYYIKWHDTFAIDAWISEEDVVARAAECNSRQESVGWLISEASDYLILSATKNSATGMLPYANICAIPKGCIKEIKKI